MDKLLSGVRIVEVSTALISGAGRAFVFYCHAFRALGAEVEAWTFAPNQPMLDELAAEGFPTRVLGLHKHGWRLSVSRALASALVEADPDCVHAHNEHTIIHASRAKAYGAIDRLIITQHEPRPQWTRRIYQRPYRLTPDLVTAVSPSYGEFLQRWFGYPPERVIPVVHPVSYALFDLPPADKALAQELGVADAHPIIIWVGRLERIKGQRDLVHAFGTVLRHYPCARLLIVGSGDDAAFLEKLSARLGIAQQVLLTGVRNDVPALLRLADIFVCPSHAESLCMAVQEAMAAGKPIVSTAVWGPCDYISDGENGLLVPIGQPRALADAILRVAADPALAKRLGEAARLYARQHFTMERFAARLGEIYMKVLNEQKASQS